MFFTYKTKKSIKAICKPPKATLFGSEFEVCPAVVEVLEMEMELAGMLVDAKGMGVEETKVFVGVFVFTGVVVVTPLVVEENEGVVV